MLRAAFESHVPTSMVERLIGSGSSGDVTSIMEILESKNCNVNEKLNGQTALHLACQNGHLAAIKCLLSHGARVDIEVREHMPSIVRLFAFFYFKLSTIKGLQRGFSYSLCCSWR